MKPIILLSGPVASGKTTLANVLVERHGCRLVKTREVISSLLGTESERAQLQQAGERLDRRTQGRWVADAIVSELRGLNQDASVVVDSVRIIPQIDAIRDAFGARVVHVHLKAPERILAERYRARSGKVQELKSYKAVQKNPTETRVEALEETADVVVDTQQNTRDDVFVRVASHLGLYGRGVERLVDVLVGGQYGSEGKGHIASYLSREYELLLRVGGPNAGHTVYERPKPYTFHHLPSGTRCSEAKIALGPGSVISVPTLLREIGDCHLETDRLFIDPQAMIIGSEDEAFETQSLARSIGSTARGVGMATARKVLSRLRKKGFPQSAPSLLSLPEGEKMKEGSHLSCRVRNDHTGVCPRKFLFPHPVRGAYGAPVQLAKEVKELRPYISETRVLLEDAFSRGQKVFLEGTQGTALSLHHGYYPHVTSRDTTVSGCLAEAGIAPSRVRQIILTCRTYPIRVQNPLGGTSGPMGRELTWKEISRRSGIPLAELRRTERTSTTHRRRRVAEFDWALLRKGASLNGPTDIALTFVDYLSISNRKARRFEHLQPETIRFVQEVERVSGAPVSLIATRFHFRSIIDRRAW